MATNSFSGSRAIFRFNNKVVAYGAGIDGNVEYSLEPVDVLDRLEVAEYVPVGYRVTFNCSVFRTVANSRSTGPISTQGPNAPADGTLGSLQQISVGMLPRSTGTPSEILTNGYMSASVTDRLTNTTLYRFQEVVTTSYNFSIAARGTVQQQVGFVATRMCDEANVP